MRVNSIWLWRWWGCRCDRVRLCGRRWLCKTLVFCCLFVYFVRRVAVWRFILVFPTGHMLQTGLFRVLIDLVVDTKLHVIRCPPQVVVVTDNAFRVDDHTGGQEQNTTGHREVQPHLGCLYSGLILD